MENIIWLNSGKVEILTKNLRILQKKPGDRAVNIW